MEAARSLPPEPTGTVERSTGKKTPKNGGCREAGPHHVFLAMNHEQWKLWKPLRREVGESLFIRYGVALILPLIALAIGLARPALAEAPFVLFLGAVVLTAANGGLAPAFVAIAVSTLLLRLALVTPQLSLHFGSDFEGMERMAVFVLVSLFCSSFVAALRRGRNHLQDSEERYRMLAETASDAIIVIDEKGEILYVNPVAEKTFGRRAETLLGLNLGCLLPGDGHQARLD